MTLHHKLAVMNDDKTKFLVIDAQHKLHLKLFPNKTSFIKNLDLLPIYDLAKQEEALLNRRIQTYEQNDNELRDEYDKLVLGVDPDSRFDRLKFSIESHQRDIRRYQKRIKELNSMKLIVVEVLLKNT